MVLLSRPSAFISRTARCEAAYLSNLHQNPRRYVRWYFRFQLSLRDIEELLFERGVIVTYAP
jgi:transposase-like protein